MHRYLEQLPTAIAVAVACALIGSGARASDLSGAPTSAYYIAVPVIDASPVTSRRTVAHPVQRCRSVPDRYAYRERHDYYASHYRQPEA